MTRALVEINGLRFDYAGRRALAGVDFRLQAGEGVALLGPNGSGKTTFALHLVGVLHGQGEVIIDGLPVIKPNLDTIRQRVGFLFQDAGEQLFMPTVLQDVCFGLLTRGVPRPAAEERARRVLAQFGLAGYEEREPHTLSAGEQRRAALAGVLVRDPKLLVLDEPTTSLDPPGARELRDLLGQLPLAKVIITHDVAWVRGLVERAVFFRDGRVVADGPLDDVVRAEDWR